MLKTYRRTHTGLALHKTLSQLRVACGRMTSAGQAPVCDALRTGSVDGISTDYHGSEGCNCNVLGKKPDSEICRDASAIAGRFVALPFGRKLQHRVTRVAWRVLQDHLRHTRSRAQITPGTLEFEAVSSTVAISPVSGNTS